MAENLNLKAAGNELVRVCMQGVRQTSMQNALALTYTQSVLTQESFQALYDTIKAAGSINKNLYEQNLEKAFRARIKAMAGSSIILPETAATPKVNGSE